MRALSCAALLTCLLPAQDVSFAQPPKAVPAGAGASISFAVSAETDVEVAVLDAKGGVVRHLAAGVLGPAAPAPFKAGSLQQTIVWDGLADYGRPAAGGPFSVRVGLGLGASYEKTVASNPESFTGISSLGVAADGTLIVSARATGAVWSGTYVVALDRDGRYQRSVMPFPSGLQADAVRAITGGFALAGRPAPFISAVRMGLYGNLAFSPDAAIAVSSDGRRYLLPSLQADKYGRGAPQITTLHADGSCGERLSVPLVTEPKATTFGRGAQLALAADGKSVLVTGLMAGSKPICALYRASLSDGVCTRVFGDPAVSGADRSHLGGAPAGVCLAPAGQILVSDRENNRVLVLGADGSCQREIAVQKPGLLGHHPGQNVLYALCSDGAKTVLRKFDLAVEPAREVHALPIPLQRHDVLTAAFDVAAPKPVIWIADRVGVLVRVEDQGATFGAPKTMNKGVFGGTAESYMAIAVDRQRGEVLSRNSAGGGTLTRYSEATDQVELVTVPGDAYGGGKGFQIMPHPDGNLYGLRWPFNFHRWDRNGKPLAWAEPIRPDDEDMLFNSHKNTGDYPIKLPDHTSFVPVGMTELPHTLGIREGDGHLFVFTMTVRGRLPKCLHEYLPSGKRVSEDPLIWFTSDAVLGPKFDAQGNIYVAEVVKPRAWQPAPEIQAHLASRAGKEGESLARTVSNMTGSIVKFTARGGSFDFANKDVGDLSNRATDNPWDAKLGKRENPFKGEPKLAESKPLEVEFCTNSGETKPAKVYGAAWLHPGIEHVGLYDCNCENVTFEVDPYGRVFFPEQHLFRIGIIDTAGNRIGSIGSYGNADNRGPESAVVDAQTGRLRAATAADAGRKNPLSEPAIAFAWPVSVGISERFLYVGDSINRRLLKLKLTYAAEARCEIK